MASIERTPHGTWRVRWRDDLGQQHARTFKRKADANAHALDIERGHTAAGSRQTVRAWADEWLDGARNLAPGGRDTYRRDLDRYVLPALGDLPLSKLTAGRIDRFLSDEQARGLAPSTVARHYRTIRRLCAVAVQRGRLPANPCQSVTPPRVEPTGMRFLTATEVDAIAERIDRRYRALVLVAAYSGLRWSELVGLRRARVDGARIEVAEQLVRRGDGWQREPPKTRASRRTVTLPGSVALELAEHLAAHAGPGPDALVFTNSRGGPLDSSNWPARHFKPAVKAAGIVGNVRPHDLRHTAVALAVAAGAHPKAIQARMGHASITMTLDRYGHIFPSIDADVADDLDRLRGR